MFQKLLRQRKDEWLRSASNTITDVLQYIRKRGKLREPQIEAIETYLFLKIAGENKPLAKLLGEGFLSQHENLNALPIAQDIRQMLETNTSARALFELRHALTGLEKITGVGFEKIDYQQVFDQFFYNIPYTDYLFSLPMGAGKTFLMASFMYLDLYFAQNEPENTAFAHNFLILAPSGLKSSIVPSLRTIAQFDPTWILPEPSASQIRRMLKFEVLDQAKTAKKTGTKNPNTQKIANQQPLEDARGLVLIVNAEKVILEKVEAGKNPILFQKTKDEKEAYANELRYWIGKIPNMSILIDEVHHAATDDIKLRQVVKKWHENGSINAVLGFSGTPYLPTAEKVTVGKATLKFTQISNTVYYYPLLNAVETFLKKPLIKVEKGENIQSLDIIRTGVQAFYEHFGTTVYADGTIAKLAIYCSSIEKLEEVVYPFLVNDLNINPHDILKYHQGNKHYKLPKENQTEFLSLDTRASQKRVVLLVQIGKEGWDCRSLTGVILSQKGDCPTNMVLQTACRCLRQVSYPENTSLPAKTALICLNEDNEKALDKQLKEEQDTSLEAIAKAGAGKKETPKRQRYDRRAHLGVPILPFYQLKVHFDEYELEAEPHTAQKLSAIQNPQPRIMQLENRELENNNQKTRAFREVLQGERAYFDYWLLQIVKESFDAITIADLRQHEPLLRAIFEKITFLQGNERFFNELYPIYELNAHIRKAFRLKRDVQSREEVIRQDAQLLIVQSLKPIDDSDKLVPNLEQTNRIVLAEQQGTSIEALIAPLNESMEKTKAIMIAQGMDTVANSLPFVKPTLLEMNKDKTLHILPYRVDSNLEKAFLEWVLQDEDFQRLGLEVYFNGEDTLTDFRIECYQRLASQKWRKIGAYFPDFLLIQRQQNTDELPTPIQKVLIVETKGEGFARNFQEKKDFMEQVFVPQNNELFGYQRFNFFYLQDDAQNPQALLNKRIKEFFGF